MATVSIPGGGGSFTTIQIGNDAKTVVAGAIKQLFTTAGKNITANEIASGVDGDKGFFNLVLDGALKATKIIAGANVQALIDTGLGSDTLIGNKSTTLFIGNNDGDSISSVTKSTIVGGAGNDTVVVTGSATAYLEGGNNLVSVSAGAVTLAGTGGNDTVDVGGGANTVSAAYKVTIDLMGKGGTDELDLAKGSTVKISGSNITTVINGSDETITISGSNEHISLTGSGDTVIIAGGSNDTITYSSPTPTKLGHLAASAVGGAGGTHHTVGIAASTGATLSGGETANLTHRAVTQHIAHTSPLADTLGGTMFKFDASAHSNHQITSFSSMQEQTAIALAAHQHSLAALKEVTMAGGHARTIFTLNHDKITILGERIIMPDKNGQ